MFRRESRILGVVIALAIFTTIAAVPFHQVAGHSHDADRGVCGVCIALSLGLAPADGGVAAGCDDAVSACIPAVDAPHVASIAHPLQVPRGPPPSLA